MNIQQMQETLGEMAKVKAAYDAAFSLDLTKPVIMVGENGGEQVRVGLSKNQAKTIARTVHNGHARRFNELAAVAGVEERLKIINGDEINIEPEPKAQFPDSLPTE